MADTPRDEIMNQLCYHKQHLLMATGLVGAFLLLTIVGFTVIPPGTPSYVLNAMNLVGLSTFFLFFGALALYCYRSERMYR